MSKIRLESIEPTETNAEQIQTILMDDLEALPSMSQQDARLISDPDSEEHVRKQYDELVTGTREYLGLRHAGDSRWLGVVRLCTWLYRDEEPFLSEVGERHRESFIHYLGLDDVSAAKLQEFAFTRSLGIEVYQEATADMLDMTMNVARQRGYKKMKASVDVENTRLQELFDRYESSTVRAVPRTFAQITTNGIMRRYALRHIHLPRNHHVEIY